MIIRFIKIIILSVFSLFLMINFINADLGNYDIRNRINPDYASINGDTLGRERKDIEINDVLLYAKKAMFSLFYIVAVGVFIFLGIKLMAARGNAEEFKKALMGFVYAVVGIVLIPMAYVLVAFVSGVNF